jgi:hypothetical protein
MSEGTASVERGDDVKLLAPGQARSEQLHPHSHHLMDASDRSNIALEKRVSLENLAFVVHNWPTDVAAIPDCPDMPA